MQWVDLVLSEPALKIEVVELFAPQHTGQRLPVNTSLIFVKGGRGDPVVELVCIGDAAVTNSVEAAEGIGHLFGREPKLDRATSARWHVERIMSSGFGSDVAGIDRGALP